MEDLRNYKKKYGHVNVKEKEDKNLYGFCNKIKHASNNPEKSSYNINDDRISRLDALRFEWSAKSNIKSFEQRIEDLQAYKEKHGHVNVKKKSEDKSLYEFCCDIRYARNRIAQGSVALSDDRISSLDALGFDWRTS